jgi:hypothetical protein
MSGGEALLCEPFDPFGGTHPFVEPPVRVGLADSLRRGQAFAHLSTTLGRIGQRSNELRVK